MLCFSDRFPTAYRTALVVLLVTTCAITSARAEVLLNAPFIIGSTRYSADELRDTFSDRIGEPVSRPLLDGIASAVQSRYRRDGLVAPAVIALDRELASSTPRIHIFEMAVEEIAIRGNPGPYFTTIMDRATDLQQGPIETRRMQIFLRRLNDLPGLEIRASFEPRPSNSHRLALVLDTKYDAISGVVRASNRGTEELGRMLIAGRLTANGLLGSHSAVSLHAATSDELDRYLYVGASIEQNFSPLTAELTITDSKATFADGYEYRSQRSSFELNTNWQLSETFAVVPFVALTLRDSEGRYPDSDISDVRTRVVELGTLARRVDADTSAYARASISRGLDALGASAFHRSGFTSDLTFTKAVADVGLVHKLAPRWRLHVDATGQWSNDDLPVGERFTFGGAMFGRAFDAAELIGDKGAAVSLQVEHIQRWNESWLRQSSLYVQGDYGYASDVFYGSDEAASLTTGIKAWLASALTRLELSKPVKRGPSDANDVRAFAQVQIVF